MKTIEDRKENATVVNIDDCFFVNCRFDACVLIYNGGDFGWQNTEFVKCRVHFQGSAARTVQFLRYFGIITPQGLGVLSTTERDAITPLTKEWIQ